MEAAIGGLFDSSATFGVRPDATPGFDAAYDQPSPPHPPGNWVQAFFPHEGGSWPTLLGNRFAVDMMQPDSAAWHMEVESTLDTGTLTLSWDTAGMSALPEGYAIILHDSGAHLTLDMRLQGSYAFSYGGQRSFSVVVRTASDVSVVTVGAKWNILSVPRIPADSAATALFPTAVSAAYGFNGSYQASPILRNGSGYWMKFGAGQDLTIAGAPLAALSVPVTEGWNLVGSVDHPIPAPSGGIIVSQFFAYTGHYVVADTLYPAMGYWVKTSAPGSIDLGAPSAPARRSAGSVAGAIPITVSGADGSEQTLALVPSGTGVAEGTDLPPVPPAGAFDVRFGSQRSAEEYDPSAREGRSHTLIIQGARAPIVVGSGRAGGAFLRLEASSDGATWLPLPASFGRTAQVMVRLAAAERPKDVLLEQNYPNPFNPSTVIRYRLPERSAVRLAVVTLLGQTVSVLADGAQDAGARAAVFDGRALDLPSGIYWYRLTGTGLETGRMFSAMKKLVLMK